MRTIVFFVASVRVADELAAVQAPRCQLHIDAVLHQHLHGVGASIGVHEGVVLHKELMARGIRVGKDRVRKLMQQHGIRAETERKFVVMTDSRHSLLVAPDLVQRRFNPETPNQLWNGGITYIASDEGWLYLTAFIDLFSRQVVGWSLGQGRAGHGVVTPPTTA